MIPKLEDLAVMLYRAGCRNRLRDIPFDDKVSIAGQISDYCLEEPVWSIIEDKYTLREFPDEKFSGLKLLAYLSEIMRDIARLDPNPELSRLVDLIADSDSYAHFKGKQINNLR